MKAEQPQRSELIPKLCDICGKPKSQCDCAEPQPKRSEPIWVPAHMTKDDEGYWADRPQRSEPKSLERCSSNPYYETHFGDSEPQENDVVEVALRNICDYAHILPEYEHEIRRQINAALAAEREKLAQATQMVHIESKRANEAENLLDIERQAALDSFKKNHHNPIVAHLNQQLAAERERYQELLYAVERKWPNETRHQTALRYIQNAERKDPEQLGSVLPIGEYDALAKVKE